MSSTQQHVLTCLPLSAGWCVCVSVRRRGLLEGVTGGEKHFRAPPRQSRGFEKIDSASYITSTFGGLTCCALSCAPSIQAQPPSPIAILWHLFVERPENSRRPVPPSLSNILSSPDPRLYQNKSRNTRRHFPLHSHHRRGDTRSRDQRQEKEADNNNGRLHFRGQWWCAGGPSFHLRRPQAGPRVQVRRQRCNKAELGRDVGLHHSAPHDRPGTHERAPPLHHRYVPRVCRGSGEIFFVLHSFVGAQQCENVMECTLADQFCQVPHLVL